MNRGHDADRLHRKLDRPPLRAARPDLALSSDFIVGFPGESDADFERTMTLVERVGFAQAFSFKYSPRPGTPASNQRKQVKDEVKSERLARLQALLNSQADDFNRRTVGVQLPVLLERPGRHPGQLVGKSPYLQAVHVDTSEAGIGDLIDVEIIAHHAHSLAGRPIAATPASLHFPSTDSTPLERHA